MQYVYGAIFLLSLVLIPLYFKCMRNTGSEPWLLALCISVSMVNLGYTLISVSGTVSFALFANKVAYLGQVFMPLCMFIMIYKLCGFKSRKWFIGVLVGMAVLMYAIILTTGHLDWYYTGATIENISGATVLRKEYGVLHPTNLIYVVSYFLAMLSVLVLSLTKHKSASQKYAVLMLTVVFGNIGIWLVQKIIPWEFELLSIIYIMSAGAFVALRFVLSDYIPKSDLHKYTQKEQERLGIEITAMSMEAKLARVMAEVDENVHLATREREILELILGNKRRREIAEMLCLSENTVKTYTRTLYSKLGVTCREDLYSMLLNEQKN